MIWANQVQQRYHSMPKYFFNVHGATPSRDDQGVDFPDDEAAWREAITSAGELMKDMDENFRPGEEWSLEVTDEEGQSVFFIVIHSKKTRRG